MSTFTATSIDEHRVDLKWISHFLLLLLLFVSVITLQRPNWIVCSIHQFHFFFFGFQIFIIRYYLTVSRMVHMIRTWKKKTLKSLFFLDLFNPAVSTRVVFFPSLLLFHIYALLFAIHFNLDSLALITEIIRSVCVR